MAKAACYLDLHADLRLDSRMLIRTMLNERRIGSSVNIKFVECALYQPLRVSGSNQP